MTGKKRILIFSTAYYPLVGGAEVAVKEITDRLSADYEFDLVTAKIKTSLLQEERVGAVNVYRIGWGKPVDKLLLTLWGGRIGQKLSQKRGGYDAIWAIMASFGGFAAENYKRQNPQVPFLLTLQEGDELKEIESKVWFVKKRFKNIFQSANQVQCISNYLANWSREMGVTGRISVVPNGVDIEKFEISNQQSETKSTDKTIITTSRLVKKNGIDDLIRSLTFLPANFKLQIVGIGPEEKELKKLAKDLNLENRIKWSGFIDQDKLPAVLRQADIFCRPSLSEGLGNSFLEAMAVGLPVIGTPVGGIPDFLQAGETGWLCQPHNPESIAKAVLEICRPDNILVVENIRQKAKNMVKDRYSWERIAGEMRTIFSQLCQKTNREF